jgi:hypothetical protein
MATIVTRSGKGSPLTHTEGDANFTNLNNDKLENINSENLGDLSNVASTAPSNGQVLTYNTSNTQWEPQTAAGGGGGISRAVLQSGANAAQISTTTNTWTQQAWAWEELKDADSIVTTSSNAFTLSAGTYLLDINLGNLTGFAPNSGSVYWPTYALRNSSDTTYPWGWGDYGQQLSATQSSHYLTGPLWLSKHIFKYLDQKLLTLCINSTHHQQGFIFNTKVPMQTGTTTQPQDHQVGL